MSPRWRRRLIIAVILAAVFFVGSSAQEQLGVSFTVEGLEAFRRWVQGLGWWGPAVYIILVIFRLFIGLSSHLVLILGGLAFGAIGGIIWGSIGLVASAIMGFAEAGISATNMMLGVSGASIVAGVFGLVMCWRGTADDRLQGDRGTQGTSTS